MKHGFIRSLCSITFIVVNLLRERRKERERERDEGREREIENFLNE